MVSRHLPLDISHILMVPSADPEKKRSAFLQTAKVNTSLVCPSQVFKQSGKKPLVIRLRRIEMVAREV